MSELLISLSQFNINLYGLKNKIAVLYYT